MDHVICLLQQLVSTHASAREATVRQMPIVLKEHGFNPRLRAGGDEAPEDVQAYQLPFQPTPPRGRRRGLARDTGRCSGVSTHASAREATSRIGAISATCRVSTHASAREATWVVCSRCGQRREFQPTPPRGRRRRGGQGGHNRFSVSTHASAREATGGANNVRYSRL